MERRLLALFFLALFSGLAFADGCMMVPDYSEKVYMPQQKAVIIWDGQEEQLILESKVSVENISDMAWLVPVESSTKPTVEEAQEQVFYDLADLFEDTRDELFKAQGFGLPTVANEGRVTVVEELKVDIYDIAILKATDSQALISWLNGNGYSFPPAFPNLLEEYVARGNTYFIANRINLENKYPGLEPTAQDFECAQEISESQYFRYDYFGYNNEMLQDSMEYILPNHPEKCDGTNHEAVAVLLSLRLGIATPLKITFSPSRPFYPMKISSLNLEQGNALLYFVSGSGAKDDSGLFGVRYMKKYEGSYLSKYGIGSGSTITMLTWEGDYKSLGKDSFFSEKQFDPALDPDYVPPEQIILQAAFFFAMLLIFVILPISVMLLMAPFAMGLIMAKVFEEKQKKGNFFNESNGFYAWLVSAILILIAPAYLFLIFLLPLLLEEYLYMPDLFNITLFLALVFLPYYVSMACGFLFKRKGHMKRFLVIPLAVLFLILAFVFFFISPF